jgi:hypothetical protein
MLLPFELVGWILATFAGILVLPTILGWVPTIFEFLVNFTLWLIWILKYRNNK